MISFSILSGLPCCAVVHENPDGSVTVRGLVNMEIEREVSDEDTCRSLAMGVNTIGASVFRTPEATSLNIGYQSLKHVRIRDNCMILGDPIE
ncbi:hypothetical protein M3P21_22245 [Ruegeria sp. 2012CJ41-6]|uniref:Uncharacterized protein n=1 Tax=Ruegeria spongiae TaxID=2942209 RepID=A0ABT0Q8L0_9RHOB|nr:hypothetical protein [Ruegeria spongiae]MCL6286216.1 hypothetical protein [Ruegeria spongiae]